MNQEPFQLSDLYEYTLHSEFDNTLQVFFTHTMSSTYFSAKQTLDLLHFLEANRGHIEALAQTLAEKRKQKKSAQERTEQLASED